MDRIDRGILCKLQNNILTPNKELSGAVAMSE